MVARGTAGGRIREGRGRVHGCYTWSTMGWLLLLDRGISLQSLYCPATTCRPTHPMDARQAPCVRVSARRCGWAIIWGVAVRSDLCLSLSVLRWGGGWCIGTDHGGRRRAGGRNDGRIGSVPGRGRARANRPVYLSHVACAHRRMHGLCLPDWPAGPVWLPQRQCRAVRSAIVLLVNDRSILRPAGAVCMLATRPVLAYFSITHSTQQDMSALYHLCQCNRVYCCFISCGCVCWCVRLSSVVSSNITFSIAHPILKLTLQIMFCTKYA